MFVDENYNVRNVYFVYIQNFNLKVNDNQNVGKTLNKVNTVMNV
jgi:hypothetical protein